MHKLLSTTSQTLLVTRPYLSLTSLARWTNLCPIQLEVPRATSCQKRTIRTCRTNRPHLSRKQTKHLANKLWTNILFQPWPSPTTNTLPIQNALCPVPIPRAKLQRALRNHRQLPTLLRRRSEQFESPLAALKKEPAWRTVVTTRRTSFRKIQTGYRAYYLRTGISVHTSPSFALD